MMTLPVLSTDYTIWGGEPKARHGHVTQGYLLFVHLLTEKEKERDKGQREEMVKVRV